MSSAFPNGTETGITRREYFAAAALAAMISQGRENGLTLDANDRATFAAQAFAFADSMEAASAQ